ncbi:MAG: type VI secretion system baseplate subunit TssG [Spirochaetaceae bacterium]|jgi:type VI secretion system protein ImpH|nr:type VI secretion system baseplate subunit TssG [Spirochaetaceae bacterium]
MENIRSVIKKAARNLRNNISVPDFWGFVRKLENANRNNPRMGYGKKPAQENVRFGQAPYLNFPASDIAEIIEGGRHAQVDSTIIVYFFGLMGVDGPMPLEFTNYVFRRSHNYFDNTWRRFLDIIHHRFLSFYYRAYAANQQAISFDRKDDDVFSNIIKSLSGLPPNIMTLRDQIERISLNSAQHFSFAVKNRWGLEDVLRRTFKFNIEVREFIPASCDIPAYCYAILGVQNSQIGVNLQIGRTYMSITGKFEIRIGPLSFDEYHEFMAGQSGFTLLTNTVALFLDRPLDYVVVFSVLSQTIPLAQLGFDLEEIRWESPQLGYNCWIGNPDEDEVTLTIAAGRLKQREHKGAKAWQN